MNSSAKLFCFKPNSIFNNSSRPLHQGLLTCCSKTDWKRKNKAALKSLIVQAKSASTTALLNFTATCAAAALRGCKQCFCTKWCLIFFFFLHKSHKQLISHTITCQQCQACGHGENELPKFNVILKVKQLWMRLQTNCWSTWTHTITTNCRVVEVPPTFCPETRTQRGVFDNTVGLGEKKESDFRRALEASWTRKISLSFPPLCNFIYCTYTFAAHRIQTHPGFEPQHRGGEQCCSSM